MLYPPVIFSSLVQGDYNFCYEIVLDVLKEAMDEGDEIALLFLKGHKSPPESSVVKDDDDQEITCTPHCPLKRMLFEYIGAIDQEESVTERANSYMHVFDDLLLAIDEVNERLQELFPGAGFGDSPQANYSPCGSPLN